MKDDYEHIVKNRILEQEGFVRAVFTGRQRGHSVPWTKVIVRPVLIRDERRLQFSYFDGKKDITKNFSDREAVRRVDELLAVAFRNILVETTKHDIQVRVTKRGKVFVHRRELKEPRPEPSMQHDRKKNLLLPDNTPDPFLEAIGIMTKDGRVRADRRKKFRQINEFLKLVVETGELQNLSQRPVTIVDCGCGNAYLTFAMYYYLNSILGLQSRVIGIDTNEDLLEEKAAQCRALGWDALSFEVARIADYRPPSSPDIVLALHACDTATDEAIAQGIKWQSGMILCVPCCHHHLRQQLVKQKAPLPLGPVLRHNVFEEHLSSILTDSFRSLVLRIAGYRAEIVELVSTEFTAKNLMIRAIKSTAPQNPNTLQEYRDLKEYWGVVPYLEHLLDLSS
jgi:SAM-dependent methyltransferase